MTLLQGLAMAAVIFVAFGLPAGAQQLHPGGQQQLVLITKLTDEQCHQSQACRDEGLALIRDWQAIIVRVAARRQNPAIEPFSNIERDGIAVLDRVDAWVAKYRIVAKQETTGSSR